ncbi:hypothetical protein M413DRAFT_449803 [Hebeloma cylindrosporum]|uniref:Uncharacterized protein n=1 Tax=Hebeloma cylindrosporum TaxID=76867 RepID=A0A0C3BTJ8_HEBCY|nr:hypothetical protein M413DRAFT_449803 [Hebeloma cylindrosporum h7]
MRGSILQEAIAPQSMSILELEDLYSNPCQLNASLSPTSWVPPLAIKSEKNREEIQMMSKRE